MLLLFLAYADLVPQVLEYQATSRTEISGGGPHAFDSNLWSPAEASTENGGSINCYTTAEGETVTLTCTNCKFVNSRVSGESKTGGAVHGRQAVFSFTNCIFDTCTATGNGGAINMKTSHALTVNNCDFNDCETGKQGAVVYRNNDPEPGVVAQEPFIFKDCVVMNCKGTGTLTGSIIYCTAVTTLEFTGNEFKCSLTADTESGIEITFQNPEATPLNIEDCKFKHEVQGEDKIRHFVKFTELYQSMKFSNTTFEGIKSSMTDGSGISTAIGFTGMLTIELCKFISISCSLGSAIYATTACDISMTQCEFDNCYSSTGGAAYLHGFKTLTMSECNFRN